MTSSWQNASSWYDKLVGDKGHYYHQHVIFPKTLELLEKLLQPHGSVNQDGPIDQKDQKKQQTDSEKKEESNKKLQEPRQNNHQKAYSLLDLACGQGALSRNLPKEFSYLGVDLAADFIAFAKKRNTNPQHKFLHADVAKPLLYVEKNAFDVATLILALQDIEDMKSVFANAFSALKNQGLLIIVLNHPIFRIPRQTSWKVDEKTNVQYRCIQSYLSPLKIPIQIEPSKQSASKEVFSYHRPLCTYTKVLHDAGFCISLMEEWISDKKSEGKCAKREDFARSQFPLFLTIVARKH
jgi:ubiquinone/menaquinone biosynthesis C-methylase UbiE